MQTSNTRLTSSCTALFERVALVEPAGWRAKLLGAFEEILASLTDTAGMALVLNSPVSFLSGGDLPSTLYAGHRSAEMERWLNGRGSDSVDEIMLNLRSAAPCSPGSEPLLLPLKATMSAGVWAIWPRPDNGIVNSTACLEGCRNTLEAVLEVMNREALLFPKGGCQLESDVARAVSSGEPEAVSVLLSLARLVSKADLVYWANLRNGMLEVNHHLGARDPAFGFELPVGEGMGGRAVAWSKHLRGLDYKSSPYRHPRVVDSCDSEGIRSGLVIPIVSSDRETGGTLYAVRRVVDDFSTAERLLLQRLTRNVRPVRHTANSYHSAFSRDYSSDKKQLRQLLRTGREVRDVELWLDRFISGRSKLLAADSRPYALRAEDYLQSLKEPIGEDRPAPVIVPLERDGSFAGANLHLWTSMALPPAGWPEFLDDVATLCSVVVERSEKSRYSRRRQRTLWLDGMLTKNPDHKLYLEGKDLGLPIERGNVWTVTWERGEEETKENRLTAIAEDASLEYLGATMTFSDGIGVILMHEEAGFLPSDFRDELLKRLGLFRPMWLLHGAAYSSPETMQQAVRQAVDVVAKARKERSERYLMRVGSLGLDDLLKHPVLRLKIQELASNLLSPLLEYDEKHHSDLTETLALALTSNSREEVAKKLYVHPNTVRLRLKQAEKVLQRDLTCPEERTIFGLSAFAWLCRPNAFTSDGN